MSVVGSLNYSGLARLCAAAICLALPGSAMLGSTVRAETTLEARKLPMDFTWHDAQSNCTQDCTGWISAVGVITSDTPTRFEEFAEKRALKGAKVVLDSSGGSVLDAISLGRRWRGLALQTTVGIVIKREAKGGIERDIMAEAYCESMCVFLLLSGNSRHVPEGAHVRVHQIWMGDRAENAKAATYSADDLMIVERDIGRLAKYTFEMGGSGELLSLALSVPPWEPLHELSADELRLTNIVTTTAMAEAKGASGDVTGSVPQKPIQDRFAGSAPVLEKSARLSPVTPTQTAEAHVPTGGTAPAASDRK